MLATSLEGVFSEKREVVIPPAIVLHPLIPTHWVAEDGPPKIDADIELSTVNGRFQTDWPVTITGRIDPRHLRATLGKGGRRIRLSTVNGNVELRKR